MSDYLMFLLSFYVLHVPLFWSGAVALLTGFLVSFLGNRIWVFGAKRETAVYSLGSQALIYIALLAVNTCVTYLIIRSLSGVSISEGVGKVVSMVVIVFWNFLIYKKLIFKVKEN